MKIALAQVNSVIGDFEGNLEKIDNRLREAAAKGVDLCVFPELAITGCPPLSLVLHNKFVSENLKFLDLFISKTRDTAAIIGYIRPVPNSVDQRIENVAALISKQEIVSTHTKSRLGYKTWDEPQFFEPAAGVKAVEFNGVKLGICFFNDILDGGDRVMGEWLNRDPVSDLVEQGAELVIAIDCSPYDYRMRGDRRDLLEETAKRHSRPILYINQVGGNDEFVFDGGSLALDAGGKEIATALDFEDDLIVVDIEKESGDLHPTVSDKDEALYNSLVLGTRDYVKKAGFTTVVIDLGADLNSSVVAAIAADAVGPDNVFGVVMPSSLSDQAVVNDAEVFANQLKIHLQVVDIDFALSAYLENIQAALREFSIARLKSSSNTRIRAMTLMSIANAFGHLTLSSFNRSQLYTGQTILSGDMAGGLSVLANVSRTLVEGITAVINRNSQTIPQSILNREPVSKAVSFHVGESGFGSYRVVDSILERLIDNNQSARATISEGFDEALVMEIVRLMDDNEHKRRQAPPGLKISVRSHLGAQVFPLGHQFRI